MSKFYIIDGNGYIHRAYHALPPLTTSKGEMVNAVYGLIRMLLKLQRQDKPDYLAVCFDHPSPTFRHKQFEAYKAHRKEIDDELKSQMPLAREAARALNIKTFEIPGYEADDTIATLARDAEKDGLEVVIVSGDKDALQLVNDKIKVFNEPKRTLFDAEKVTEKYGLRPDQLVDMFALMGDASDNVPGIKGIGEKTAVKLIQKYETLENLLENAGSLEGKLKELFLSGREEALKSKNLVFLDDKVPLEGGWKECYHKEYEREKLSEFLRRLEFNSLLKEILPPDPGEPKPAVKTGSLAKTSVVYADSDELKELSEKLSEARSCALFFINSDEDPGSALIGVSAAVEPGKAYYLPLAHSELSPKGQLSEKEAIELLKGFFEDAGSDKLLYDLKTAGRILQARGIKLRGECFDVMLAAYCLNPSKPSYELKDIALDHLARELNDFSELAGTGKKRVPYRDIAIETAADSACRSVSVVFELKPFFEEKLIEKQLEALFSGMETPLARVLADMETNGLKINESYFRELSRKFEIEVKGIEKKIYESAGQEFNPASPKQLSFILFEKLGLPAVKKTKTGYSTDEEVLRSLAPSHELPAKLLEFREIQKLKSTYVDPLLEKVDRNTSRIHTTFNQTGTATGRLSSSNPNLQNIPIRTEYGKEIRRGFIPDKGYTFLSADYSQIDLRVLAHISGDHMLINAFKENIDVHTATAAEVFGKKPSEISRELRRIAKTINFGIIYGMSPFGLAQQLGISNAEAKQYIDRYFARYSGVKEWTEKIIEEARANGCVKTLLGRIRYLPEINSPNHQIRSFAERMAMNTPVQGTSADIIKVAMINLFKRLGDEKRKSRLLVQVHDDLLFEISDNDTGTLPIMIKSDMESAVKLKVPVIVDLKTGKNWADLSKMEEGRGKKE
ncbi:MAG: DNA polymerase I [Elusimicrobiota bacterium]